MLTRTRPLVEVAVDSVIAAEMAAALGADRLELCQDLELGGTTPSLGLIEAVRARVSIPVVVMIRTRAGDFRYHAEELRVMAADIRHAVAAGMNGVVVGPLAADGTIDREGLRQLVAAAGPVPVTFHRAFDFATKPFEALEVLVAHGVTRLLTSGGGAPTAFEGRAAIGRLVNRAGERLAVIAGGGVAAEHVSALVDATGVREIHLSGSTRAGGAGPFGATPGPDPGRLQRLMDELALHFTRGPGA